MKLELKMKVKLNRILKLEDWITINTQTEKKH